MRVYLPATLPLLDVEDTVAEMHRAADLGFKVVFLTTGQPFDMPPYHHDEWRWLDSPVKRLGGLDVPAMPYAPAMEEAFMPNPEKIATALRELAAY